MKRRIRSKQRELRRIQDSMPQIYAVRCAYEAVWLKTITRYRPDINGVIVGPWDNEEACEDFCDRFNMYNGGRILRYREVVREPQPR
ncbi:MAG: hypothetical protein HC888_06765 [Candidatus Competibacteraceae bacterium]|nr:hypothetical protein [Candidatus Competibacteraceae bacterium]